MAVFIPSPTITVNAVDLTNHVDSLTLELTPAEVDTTAFSSAAGLQWSTSIAGIVKGKFSVEFQQDLASASVNSTIYPLIGTAVPITFRALAGATSSVNPAWVFNVLITDWKPLDAKVGALALSSITWPVTGAVVQSNT